MPRASKSQWDFGELFPPEQTRRVLTVSELTTQVKRLVEQHLGTVWVTGEITNLREQASGHIYFTLKDAATQVACVLFRRERVAHRTLMEDGQKVTLQGDVTVYEARGQYQVIVRQVELQGLGALQAAFEKLKQKLAAEGLFAEERKRPLPQYPQCLGIVTSSTAAALQDVLHVVRRRNPALRLILAPCRVQGAGAAGEIAAAIGLLNEWHGAQPSGPSAPESPAGGRCPLDAILVTRGGGSLEDLWAFNEEEVARAIASSAIPVVSAVGHEIDFTISDFVADLRAATPSAAAEILTEGVFSVTSFVRDAPERLRDAVLGLVVQGREGLGTILGRMGRAHPRRRLNEAAQQLDDLQASVGRSVREGVRHAQMRSGHLSDRLLRSQPRTTVEGARADLEREQKRLTELAHRSHRRLADQLQAAEARLKLLGPEQVLARGYSITTDAVTGKVLRAAAEVHTGQTLHTRLHQGGMVSKVQESD
jgi:exodeoxyribonuclease VII large subunit